MDKVGFRIEGAEFHHAIFADNIVLIARDTNDAQRMIDDITQCILDIGLQWKPTSIECMTTGNLREQTIDSYTWSNGNYVRIPQNEHITTLGTKLDPEGTTTTSNYTSRFR